MMSLRPRHALSVALVSVFIASNGLLAGGQRVDDVNVTQGPAARPGPRDMLPQPSALPAGTAVVEGTVVSADLGRPVRRATVRLSSTTPGPPLTKTSDDAGRFRFDDVPAGQFLLTASKPGYLESAYGQRQPGAGRPGTPLSVATGQRIERLALPLARGGVLAGTVADDGGEPAFGTEVRAFRFTWQTGQRVLRLAGSARTDDRGAFRIGALPPGDYILMASPSGNAGTFDEMGFPKLLAGAAFTPAVAAREPAASTAAIPVAGFAPVFFPGTTSSGDASRVTLGVSEERTGLDLQLPFVAMGRIAGTVVGDSASVAGTEVRLIDVDLPPPGFGVRVTGTDPDGRFSFENVPPGRYRLQAHSGPRNQVMVDQSGGNTRVTMAFTAVRVEGRSVADLGPPSGREVTDETRWAAADVAVSGPVTEAVTLVLQPGVTVSGRIQFDGSDQPPADLTAIRVVLNSANATAGGMSSAMAQVDEDGQFAIMGVTPGTYRVVVLSASDWRPKAFDVGGRDALDFLLTVDANEAIGDARLTLTTKTSTLSGTLLDASGRPTPAHTIVLFADDAAYWTPHSRRIHATRPSTDGRFSIGNLPPGAYRLVAVDDLEDGQWFDPEVLRQLSAAALSLTLGDGEQRAQDIRVAQ